MVKINKKDIKEGEGKYAPNPKGNHGWVVFKDEQGKISVFSADCPHLHCDVSSWDLENKKWICPCHGSEFDIQGKVLKGPASQGLAPKPFQEQGDEIILE